MQALKGKCRAVILFTPNAPVRPRRGRPPQPVPAKLAESMLEWVADGRPLASWCNRVGRVSVRAVHYWLDKDAELARRYDIAREVGFDSLCELALMAAKAPVRTSVDLAAAKLRVRTILKLLDRWYPKGRPRQRGPCRI